MDEKQESILNNQKIKKISQELKDDMKRSSQRKKENKSENNRVTTEDEFIKKINKMLFQYQLKFWKLQIKRGSDEEKEDINLKLQNPFQTIYNAIKEYEDEGRFIQALKADCKKTLKLRSFLSDLILFATVAISVISLGASSLENRDKIIFMALGAVIALVVACKICNDSCTYENKAFILEVIEAYEQDQKNKLQESQKEA